MAAFAALLLAHQLGNTFHTAFILIFRYPVELSTKIFSVDAASLGPLHVKCVRLLLAQLFCWRHFAVAAYLFFVSARPQNFEPSACWDFFPLDQACGVGV